MKTNDSRDFDLVPWSSAKVSSCRKSAMGSLARESTSRGRDPAQSDAMTVRGLKLPRSVFSEDEDRDLIQFVVENKCKFGGDPGTVGIWIADIFRIRHPEMKLRHSAMDIESRLLLIKKHIESYLLSPDRGMMTEKAGYPHRSREKLGSSLRARLFGPARTSNGLPSSFPRGIYTRVFPYIASVAQTGRELAFTPSDFHGHVRNPHHEYETAQFLWENLDTWNDDQETQSAGSRTTSNGRCLSFSGSPDSSRVSSSAATPRREPITPKITKLKGLPHWEDSMGGYQLAVAPLDGSRVDENSLTGLFGRFGNVVSAQVVITRSGQRHGHSRAVGFVVMDNFEEAEEAGTRLSGVRFHGMQLNVAWARPLGDREHGSTQLTPGSQSSRGCRRNSIRNSSPSPTRSQRYSASRSPRPAGRYGSSLCGVAREPASRGNSLTNPEIASGSRLDEPELFSAVRLPAPTRKRLFSEDIDEKKKPRNGTFHPGSKIPLSAVRVANSGSSVARTRPVDRTSRLDGKLVTDQGGQEPKTALDWIASRAAPDSGPLAKESTQRFTGFAHEQTITNGAVAPERSASFHSLTTQTVIGPDGLDLDAARVKKLMENAKITAEEAFVLYIKNRSLYEKLGLNLDDS